MGGARPDERSLQRLRRAHPILVAGGERRRARPHHKLRALRAGPELRETNKLQSGLHFFQVLRGGGLQDSAYGFAGKSLPREAARMVAGRSALQ